MQASIGMLRMIPPPGLMVTARDEQTLKLRTSDALWKAILTPVSTVALAILYVIVGADGLSAGGATRKGTAIAVAVAGCALSLCWRLCFVSSLDVSASTVRVIGVFLRAEFDVGSVRRIEAPGAGRSFVSMRLMNGSSLYVGALPAAPETTAYVGHLIKSRQNDDAEHTSSTEVQVDWRPYLHPSDIVALVALTAAFLLGATG
ncbi:hypothetical protein G3I20_24980 [Streptomyces sp. SID8111]|uniref:hypothetical protein n=1 Tax=Streptomyces sp. SID8111 TaxID=2706100 RepID=UPI0013BF9742|nr:hypothetical protein [Streptomyces sp. SID8111]NEC29748.1 hypothetical protein [Streptomyces sp. SID8111]